MRADSSAIAELVKRYGLPKGTPQLSPEAFKKKFEDMRQSFADRLAAGQRANVFSLLGMERLETDHSRVLKGLLDPLGGHGEGVLFLRQFCQIAKVPDLPDTLWTTFPPAAFWVGREFPIASGRLDIIVISLAAQFLLVIENKIEASESEEQLYKYYKWMEQLKHYKFRGLGFLTLTGEPSRDDDKFPYFRISYKDHIVQWLESCCKLLHSPRMRETLAQYLSIVRGLTGGFMNEYEESIANFLSQPNELPFFADLLKVGDPVKSRLVSRFWEAVMQNVSRLLEARPDLIGSFLGKGGERLGIRISLANDPLGRDACFVTFEQEAVLTYGVRFPENKRRSSQLPLLKEIREVLRKRGFDLQSDEGYWIGWLKIRDYSLKDIETLGRVSVDGGFVSAAASILYELADEVGGVMRDLDEALAQADKSIESS
jgi:hypothetical protein